ncbi:MAG: class B sortase [Oscillospiraceae bacterium]|nr:class B sortase [Oscillospiraceae bacterium]
MKQKIRAAAAVVLMGALVFSGSKIWVETKAYRSESDLHKQLLRLKPAPPDEAAPGASQGLPGLQGRNSDTVGWLTVPGTRIDYPFVRGPDNDFYLHRDFNGAYALAGTLFMDYRCAKDFSSKNTIIYGHHMKNGSMFGSLKKFQDKDFFAANSGAVIYLPDKIYALELFAFLSARSDDAILYTEAPDEGFLAYVKRNARQYRDIGASAGDRFVTLSTCSYEFNNARMVLIGRIAESKEE